MNRIQILSEEVISKISAGEVVERPASVVKELVENSLDAGAKNIVIEIKNAGKKLIRVSDDGLGMSKEELPLALERYATSKISSLTDLKRINTLGFRGEALPSIAAVSKFILISRKENSNNGSRIYAESGKIKDNHETGSPVGTTVEVKDLFYNTPARLKFLKTDSTEKEQIFNIVYDLALAYPEISFRLIDESRKDILRDEGKEILNCPGVDNPKNRIAQLFGYQILEYLFPFAETINFYTISGLLSYPSYSRATKIQQFFSVDNRPIRSRILQHSVYESYRQFLSPGRHPAFFLYLQCPPESIDVNVHPTKREIRLSGEENLHHRLSSAIKEKLLKPRTIPEIRIPVETTEKLQTTEKLKEAATSKATQEEFLTPKNFSSLTIIPLGQLGKLYILAQSDEGLLVIDQHAAEERILYEKFKNALTENKLEIQRLLNPIIIELSLQQYEILSLIPENKFLKELGFEIEEFGGRSFIVHSVPAILASGIDEKVIRDLLDNLSEEIGKPRPCVQERGKEKNQKSELPEGIKEKIVRNACRSAVKAKDNLEKEEMYRLVEELKKCAHPYNCPHGRPTLIRLNYDELNRRFGR